MKKKNIAEKLIEKVEIKLGNKTYPVVMTHNVLIDIEEQSGLNLLSGEASIIKPSFKAMRAMLYAVMTRAGEEIHIEDVGKLIGPHNLMSLQEAFLNAWAASMPKEEREKAANPTKAVAAA